MNTIGHEMNGLGVDEARYEIKFVGNPQSDTSRLLQWLKTHELGFKRAYPGRRINNIYFDSHGLSTFTTNIAGTSGRSKYRLRWYGETLRPQKGTYEQKIRRGRLGWKTLHKIDELPCFGSECWQTICASIRFQLPPEQQLIAKMLGEPIILTGYKRDYYVSRNGVFRVTLDLNHFAYEQRHQSHPNLSRRTNVPSPLVVEVKFAYGLEREGQRLVRNIPLRLSRHSKYNRKNK